MIFYIFNRAVVRTARRSRQSSPGFCAWGGVGGRQGSAPPPAAVARGSPVVGELSPEVTEGLKALRSGKTLAFPLALNDGRDRRGRKGGREAGGRKRQKLA